MCSSWTHSSTRSSGPTAPDPQLCAQLPDPQLCAQLLDPQLRTAPRSKDPHLRVLLLDPQPHIPSWDSPEDAPTTPVTPTTRAHCPHFQPLQPHTSTCGPHSHSKVGLELPEHKGSQPHSGTPSPTAAPPAPRCALSSALTFGSHPTTDPTGAQEGLSPPGGPDTASSAASGRAESKGGPIGQHRAAEPGRDPQQQELRPEPAPAPRRIQTPGRLAHNQNQALDSRPPSLTTRTWAPGPFRTRVGAPGPPAWSQDLGNGTAAPGPSEPGSASLRTRAPGLPQNRGSRPPSEPGLQASLAHSQELSTGITALGPSEPGAELGPRLPGSEPGRQHQPPSLPPSLPADQERGSKIPHSEPGPGRWAATAGPLRTGAAGPPAQNQDRRFRALSLQIGASGLLAHNQDRGTGTTAVGPFRTGAPAPLIWNRDRSTRPSPLTTRSTAQRPLTRNQDRGAGITAVGPFRTGAPGPLKAGPGHWGRYSGTPQNRGCRLPHSEPGR